MIVASAQYPITQHADVGSWAAHTERWVKDAVRQNANLLLFPEYGSIELVSVFPEHIQKNIRDQVVEMDSLKETFCSVFARLAAKYQLTIVAPSFPVIEKNKIVNRAYVFSPSGLAGYQDKFFMTRFENEEWGIHSGEKILTLFEASWGSFGIQICYDVEFSFGAQLLGAAGASLLLAPSCTETIRGATRVHVGARARAMENQFYTVVSQTIGDAAYSPAVDINFGYAACYSTPDKNLPEEGILSSKTPQEEGWLIQHLDFALIDEVRRDGQVFNFKDLQRTQPSLTGEKVQILKQSI
jgi:predicted amidohydrolase